MTHCFTVGNRRKPIDATILDPLVTLHGVPYNDMQNGHRIFAGIADQQNCAVELSHDTRKTARRVHRRLTRWTTCAGASALKDAMRAVRMLKLDDQTGRGGGSIFEFERASDFR